MTTATTEIPLNQEGEKKQPTKEEVVNWYKEQIELQTLRHELARLQSEAVQFKAQELQAMAFIAQFEDESEKEVSSPKPQ